MTYRVVLLRNGEYKKTLHRCKTMETSFINYHGLIEENKLVMFPKRFINYNGIKPVEYQIMVVKDKEDTDKNRFVRDKTGKLVEEQPLGGIWTILASENYEIEEKFWLYGYDAKAERPTIHTIIQKLMDGAYKKNMVKQVIVVHNKLVIHNEDQFDMVVCKCLEDAQRLHHSLHKATRKNKIKSLVFLGTATPATISIMYELIHEKTKWPYTKIRRTSTRP